MSLGLYDLPSQLFSAKGIVNIIFFYIPSFTASLKAANVAQAPPLSMNMLSM